MSESTVMLAEDAVRVFVGCGVVPRAQAPGWVFRRFLDLFCCFVELGGYGHSSTRRRDVHEAKLSVQRSVGIGFSKLRLLGMFIVRRRRRIGRRYNQQRRIGRHFERRWRQQGRLALDRWRRRLGRQLGGGR